MRYFSSVAALTLLLGFAHGNPQVFNSSDGKASLTLPDAKEFLHCNTLPVTWAAPKGGPRNWEVDIGRNHDFGDPMMVGNDDTPSKISGTFNVFLNSSLIKGDSKYATFMFDFVYKKDGKDVLGQSITADSIEILPRDPKFDENCHIIAK
ncbi:hypothetical protein T439DRAFT_353917 [Meredithblackwellia eburnea MCA 4105]